MHENAEKVVAKYLFVWVSNTSILSLSRVTKNTLIESLKRFNKFRVYLNNCFRKFFMNFKRYFCSNLANFWNIFIEFLTWFGHFWDIQGTISLHFCPFRPSMDQKRAKIDQNQPENFQLLAHFDNFCLIQKSSILN